MAAKKVNTVNTEMLKAELEKYFAQQAVAASPAWRPSPGDTLVGAVVGKRMGVDNGYGAYPIIVVQTEDGATVSVHIFHQVLRDALKNIGVTDGMMIAITYIGEEVTNATADEVPEKQTKYHMYYAADLSKLDEEETSFEL